MIDALTGIHLLDYVYDEGGRGDHFKGFAGDCVTRSIAIATELPYMEVYEALRGGQKAVLEASRPGTKKHARYLKDTSPRNGVRRSVYQPYLESLGWTWVPTMQIGSGTTVHLRADELPSGRIIARVSKHMVAIVDGVIHDNHNPDRGGSRAVYGYFTKES